MLSFSLLLTISNYCYAQVLNTDETIEYLERTLNNYLSKQENYFGEQKSVSINVLDGSNISIKYYLENLSDAIVPEFNLKGINYNEICFHIDDVIKLGKKKINDKYIVSLNCEDSTKDCFNLKTESIEWHFAEDFCDRPNAFNHYDYLHLFYLDNFNQQEKIFNAFSHLLNELNFSSELNELSDPFSDVSEITGQRSASNHEIITLSDSHGVSVLKVSLSGLNFSAILDSGASDISIPTTIERELLEKKIITKDDYVAPGLYMIADGSLVISARFKIPYIKIGNIKIKDIYCSVNQSDDVFLLGKSVLNRFKSWKIDNENNKLILEY